MGKSFTHAELGLTTPKVRRHTGDPFGHQDNRWQIREQPAGVLVDSVPMESERRSVTGLAPDAKHAELLRRAFECPLDLPQPDPEAWNPNEVRLGYLRVKVLPELIGNRWDKTSKALAMTCRPSIIRVLHAGVAPSVDSVWWRLTIWLGEDGKITKCEQECKVPLPASVPNGQLLRQMLAIPE